MNEDDALLEVLREYIDDDGDKEVYDEAVAQLARLKQRCINAETDYKYIDVENAQLKRRIENGEKEFERVSKNLNTEIDKALEQNAQLRTEREHWKSVVDGINKTMNATTTTDTLMKIAQLRAELAQLKAENVQLKTYLKVTCHVKSLDKVGFDFEILGKINDLQEQLDEARKVISGHPPMRASDNSPLADWFRKTTAFLKAHPERK